jgi:hypothetical protein
MGDEMHAITRAILLSAACSLSSTYALAQSTQCNKDNYAERKAHILNLAPGLEITQYDFCNVDGPRYENQFVEKLSWRNTSSQDIVSYEYVTIKYDPFNRRLIGSKSIIGGTTSANWTPLRPDASSADGLIDRGTSHVYTGIAYVRAVRYADGKVWIADPAKVAEAVKRLGIEVKEFDELGPDKPQTRT